MASVRCPTCGTELPCDPRFVTWCHDCGWNLKPPPLREGRRGRLDRVSDRVAQRLDDGLFARLAGGGALQSRLTAAKAGAYAIAVVVHAFTLGLVVLGVWLIAGDHGVVLKIAGVLLLGLAYLMRPRLGKRPTEGVVPRAEAPALYRLADEIAQQLGTEPPDTIAVTHEYNASWSVAGLAALRPRLSRRLVDEYRLSVEA